MGSLIENWEDPLLLDVALSPERFYYIVVFKHFLWSLRTFLLKGCRILVHKTDENGAAVLT